MNLSVWHGWKWHSSNWEKPEKCISRVCIKGKEGRREERKRWGGAVWGREGERKAEEERKRHTAGERAARLTPLLLQHPFWEILFRRGVRYISHKLERKTGPDPLRREDTGEILHNQGSLAFTVTSDSSGGVWKFPSFGGEPFPGCVGDAEFDSEWGPAGFTCSGAGSTPVEILHLFLFFSSSLHDIISLVRAGISGESNPEEFSLQQESQREWIMYKFTEGHLVRKEVSFNQEELWIGLWFRETGRIFASFLDVQQHRALLVTDCLVDYTVMDEIWR